MAWVWNGTQMVNVPDNTMGAMNNMGMPPYAPMGAQMPAYGAQPHGANYQGQQQTPAQGANNAVQTNIVRVHGFDGAMNYPLPNNYVAMLYDNEKDLAYYVQVDSTGKRTVTTMELSEHKDEPPVDFSAFATKDDIAKLREEFASASKTATKKPLIDKE